MRIAGSSFSLRFIQTFHLKTTRVRRAGEKISDFCTAIGERSELFNRHRKSGGGGGWGMGVQVLCFSNYPGFLMGQNSRMFRENILESLMCE